MVVANLKALVEVLGVPQSNAKLRDFQKNLVEISTSSAVAELSADLNTKGFDGYEAAIKTAKASASDPIVQELQLRYDEASAISASAAAKVAREAFERGHPFKAGAITQELNAEVDDTGFHEFEDDLAEIRAETAAPITQDIRFDTSGLSEAVASVKAASAAIAATGSGGGGGRGFLPTLAWGGHSPGGRGPWWSRLLLGGGLLAGAGSLGSFAGFGAEHFLFTGLGLAGSAGAGLAGGGLIGAGALGTMAVGGGSDLAVVKSTLTDTQQLGKATEAVDKAMQLYGQHSKQAATAVAHLKLLESELGGGKGVKAERVLAERADALNEFWDKATQGARVQAAHVLDQVVGLGRAYVPKVAHAAEQNLSIIDKSLKPLFSWLEGPQGMGVFNTLEGEFKHNLPHAMHAFDQGVEFILKTLANASHYTGGFVESIDGFFTKWNEPQNFAKWREDIAHLIGDFHLWGHFVKTLGSDIVGLFSQDAHTGNAIVTSLTHMLEKLGEWEHSTQGKKELHNLFVVHKEEILALLSVIPPLVRALEPIYMTISPPLVKAVTVVAKAFAGLLTLLDESGPITRWALGLTAIGLKLGFLKAPFVAAGKWMWAPFAALLAKMPLIGGFFGTTVSETEGLTAATEALTTAVENLTAAYATMGTAAEGATGAGAVGAASRTEIGAGIGAQTEEALGLGAGAGAGGAGISAPVVAAAAGSAYLIGEIALQNFSSNATKAEDRLKQLDARGKGAVGSIQRLGEGLPGWLKAGSDLWAESGDKAHRVLQIMELMHLVGAKRSVQLRKEGDQLLQDLELTKGQREEYEQMLSKAQQSNVQVTFHRGVQTLRSGTVTRLSDIKKLAAENAAEAARGWKVGSKDWRRATAENMLGVVVAIKEGEAQGAITVEKGQEAIAHYLREYHLIKGDDPFHIADAFTSSWAKAGHVNESQIDHALGELRKMGPVARSLAREMMLEQVREYEHGGQLAKGSFSRLRSAIVTEMKTTKERSLQEMVGLVKGLATGSLSMDEAVSAGLTVLGKNVNSALKGFGVGKKLSFSLTTLGKAAAGVGLGMLGIQRGGHINIGKPSGDSVPAMLEKGEYVLNRNAVNAVGLQNLDALNYGAASRFQKGGQAGRLHEPQITGPGALHTLGQAGIHDAYKAAQHYLSGKGGFSGTGAFGSGKSETERQLEALWVSAGGSRGTAHLMAAIAMAESGGDPRAHNASGASGLWQIMMPANQGYVHGSVWNPLANARAALAILKSQGLGAWETYSTGAYRQYMQAGGAVDPSRVLSAADRKRYLAQKWKGARLLGGGLIGAAEHELGVPGSHHKPHEHATASDAVHWAMRHLGSGDQWGYPGEWCGAFLGADMRALGLPVPSGYPSAASWANYGTPLGRNHIQAGAILDYGSAHVALAISSSAQIQGNDIHGQVGTSGIGGTIGGSPLTAVRWPPYGTGPGAGSAPAEPPVPTQFAGAQTAALSLSVPKSLQGVEREIAKWTGRLRVYEHAAKLASGRPKLQAAIHRNVMRIQKYLRELDRARHKLRVAKARHRYSGKLGRALGRITGMESQIEGAQRAYEAANQFAEQIVSLEPTEPILAPNASEEQQRKAQEAYVATFNKHVDVEERPAYANVLGKEAAWRNTILAAEAKATGIEGNWEYQIRGKVAEEKAIKRYAENVEKHLHDYRAKHPTGPLPEWLQIQLGNRKDLLEKLPTLRFQERELRKVLGGGRAAFYGGTHPYGPVHPPTPPRPGTGSFEEALVGVQGIHWPGQHEFLAALPPYREAGRFGGAIWQTQEAIEGLGLKIEQASAALGGPGGSGGQKNTEREHLLEELLLQANQRELLREVERRTLGSAHLLPYAGAYATGGPVAALVGEQGPEIIAAQPGSYIHNASESRSMLTPQMNVVVNVYEGDGTADVEINDQKVEAVVNRMDRRSARGARRGMARAGV